MGCPNWELKDLHPTEVDTENIVFIPVPRFLQLY